MRFIAIAALYSHKLSELKLDVDISRLFRENKLPLMLQAEATECGLACLGMVAAFHGKNLSLTELRRRFSASLNGTTLEAMIQMADSLELIARPLRLEIEELRELQCPTILHWDLNHFVVLKKATADKVWIHDPAKGARCLQIHSISGNFTGVAVEFTPASNFEKQEQKDKAKLSDFYSSVKGLTKYITQMVALTLVLQVFTVLSPILNQVIVDTVVSRGDASFLLVAVCGMAFLLVLNTSTTLLRGYVSLYVGTQLSFAMQTNLFRHAIKLPSAWFEKRHVGDILSRFGSLGPVQSVISSAAANIILNSLMTITTIVMMLMYSPLLCAIEVGLVIVFLALRFAAFPYVQRKLDEGLTLNARVSTTFLETIRGSRAFKLFGAERERLAVWQNEQMDATNNSVQLAKFGLWGGAGGSLLAGAQGIAVWYLGIRAVINGDMTLGMLFAFQAYAAQFGGATSGLIAQAFSLKSVELHLERLADVVHSKPEDGIDTPRTDKVLEGAIALRGASFQYADHEPRIIKDAELLIHPGDFACFIGPSGQGKTTLLKMLVGLHAPTDGQFLVDGQPLSRFGITNYRAQIGVVLQDDQLFTGTIAENIAFFDPQMRMDRVEEAARLAHIHDDISELPMGYQSLVGDMGSTLSGGQRQRVFLARALYRKPRILFLDEGTANLDPERERQVMATLSSLRITRIIIAHREAAMEGANRLFEVRRGFVHELPAKPAFADAIAGATPRLAPITPET